MRAHCSPLGFARGLALFLAFVAGGGCGIAPAGPKAIRVDAEMLPWADVSHYRTYRWWAQPLDQGRGGYDEREALIDWRVRHAVERELAGHGYAPAGTGAADFVVSYDVRLEDASTSSFQDYLQYRAEGGGKDMGDSFIGYERGTLVLQITDAPTRRAAWRATASAIVDGDARGQRIDPAVQQMLAQFPAAR